MAFIPSCSHSFPSNIYYTLYRSFTYNLVFYWKKHRNAAIWLIIIFAIIYFGILYFSVLKDQLQKAGITRQIKIVTCSIKVAIAGGDISLCYEEEETVEKVGSYETLNVKLGKIKIDNKEIPSGRPEAGKSYTLDILLENENDIGSDFNIYVTSLDVIASPVYDKVHENAVAADNVEFSWEYSCSDFYDKETCEKYGCGWSDRNAICIGNIVSMIKPQRHALATAYFETMPTDTDTIYFFATAESKQRGGGSSKFKLIPELSDYQDSMFFDPEIKTTAGPIDVYVYTNPYVIVSSGKTKMIDFDVKIRLYNGGYDGTAYMNTITVYQTFENVDNKLFNINIDECKIGSVEITRDNIKTIPCPRDKKGNCFELNFTEDFLLEIKPGNSKEISCVAEDLVDIDREITNTIGVTADYTYTQDEIKTAIPVEKSD